MLHLGTLGLGTIGAAAPGKVISIFDLVVNGQKLLVNNQQLKVTGDGD